MNTDKPGFWSFAKTPWGASLLTGALVAVSILLGQGILKPGDLRGHASSSSVVDEKEALRLYIDQAATAAAEKVMARSDERWKERLDSLKEKVDRLEQSARWSNSRADTLSRLRNNP